MWRKHLFVVLLGAGCAAAPAGLARGQAPGTENVALPPEVQPTIASSVPALAVFKNALFDLGYNLQLSYLADSATVVCLRLPLLRKCAAIRSPLRKISTVLARPARAADVPQRLLHWVTTRKSIVLPKSIRSTA
jgi:hypothetical protein